LAVSEERSDRVKGVENGATGTVTEGREIDSDGMLGYRDGMSQGKGLRRVRVKEREHNRSCKK
jgi:hypothetical protein